MESLTLLKFGIIGGIVGIVAILSILLFVIDRPEPEEMVLKDVVFSVKEFNISKKDDITEAVVTFSFINPNTRTIILETLNYELYADGKRVGFGSIGERLEGLFTSSGRTYLLPPGVSLDEAVSIMINDTLSNDVEWRIKGNYIILEPQIESGREYTFDLPLKDIP